LNNNRLPTLRRSNISNKDMQREINEVAMNAKIKDKKSALISIINKYQNKE